MVRGWLSVLLVLVLAGCSYLPVGLRPTPRPQLVAGPASPCGWQVLGNTALALPDSATKIWVCGVGWDDRPLTGSPVAALLATIEEHRTDPAQACGGVGSEPFFLFLDGVDGDPDARTGLIGLPGDCFFAENYDMTAVFAAITAAFTASHGPARTVPAGGLCQAPEGATGVLGSALVAVVACQNSDYPATGLAGSTTVRPTPAQQAVLLRMFEGARTQLRYYQASVPEQLSVVRVSTGQGVRTVWFDGKDLWLPGEVMYQIGPRQDVLVALRELTGR